jgi:phosphocarrier protein HPr
MSSRVTGSGQGPRDTVPPGPRSPQPDPPAGGAGPFRRTVRIVNPLGLHPRAADRFCRAAKKYSCAVTVYNGDRRADGKDIWDLIGLLVFPGMEVILEVEGADAAIAIEPLAAILGAPGGEDYTI